MALLLTEALNPIAAVAVEEFAAFDSRVQCRAEIYAAWRQSDHSKAMQLTNVINGNRKGSVMWIPPQYDGGVAFIAGWLNEQDTENRLEGDQVLLSFRTSL